jgi:hypothetical protein
VHRPVRALVFFAVVSGLLVFVTGPAAAQQPFSVTITFDENGNGNLTNTNGFYDVLPWYLLNDPGPGGLANVLFYDTLTPPGLVAGDLLIYEPVDNKGAGILSDVLRFDPNPFNGGVFVYSDNNEPGSGDLADVGFPTANYTNVLSMIEVGGEGFNGISYTPIAGQPGFVGNAAGPVTYNFTSDVVPEPGTLLLLVSGLGALGVAAWRKRK